jgi:hypothetical protein
MSKHVHRFYTAVSVLASHGHIKQRLVQAYEGNLTYIDDDDMPSALRKSFADLRRQMNHVAPLNGEGPICASVRKMSIDEADECAHRIIDLYGDMIRLVDHSQTTLPLPGEDKASISTPVLVKAN